jgi:CheY-like chemotaxis protein
MIQKTILLLEDDENDVFVFRRALAAVDYKGHVRVVSTVREAREYMEGAGGYHDRNYFPLPDLIVADFGLSGERGSDFVTWLRTHPEYNAIPVIFFSGSIPSAQLPALIRQFNLPVFVKHVEFQQAVKSVREMIQHVKDSVKKVPPPSK